MPAFQVRIAYLTAARRSRRYFHDIVLTVDRASAVREGLARLEKRSPGARVVHQAAFLRPDSRDAETAILSGWRLSKNWWTRPMKPDDDLAAIAAHGHVDLRGVNARSTAACVAIDQAVRRHPYAEGSSTSKRPSWNSESLRTNALPSPAT